MGLYVICFLLRHTQRARHTNTPASAQTSTLEVCSVQRCAVQCTPASRTAQTAPRVSPIPLQRPSSKTQEGSSYGTSTSTTRKHCAARAERRAPIHFTLSTNDSRQTEVAHLAGHIPSQQQDRARGSGSHASHLTHASSYWSAASSSLSKSGVPSPVAPSQPSVAAKPYLSAPVPRPMALVPLTMSVKQSALE